MCTAAYPAPVSSVSTAGDVSEDPASTWIWSDGMFNKLGGSIALATALAVLTAERLPGHKEKDSNPNRLPSFDLAPPSSPSPATTPAIEDAAQQQLQQAHILPVECQVPHERAHSANKLLLPPEALHRIASHAARASHPSFNIASKANLFLPIGNSFTTQILPMDVDTVSTRRRSLRSSLSSVTFSPDAEWLLFDIDEAASGPAIKLLPIRPPARCPGDESPPNAWAAQVPSSMLTSEAHKCAACDTPSCTCSATHRSFSTVPPVGIPCLSLAEPGPGGTLLSPRTPKASPARAPPHDAYLGSCDAKTPKANVSTPTGFDFDSLSEDESDGSDFGSGSASTSSHDEDAEPTMTPHD